jgi:hypothetical protein
MNCHEDIDKPKPADHQVASLFENGKFKAVNVTAIPAEVKFSHKNHTVDAKVACAECHPGIPKSNAITTEVRVEMKDCISCHAKTIQAGNVTQIGTDANDCAICHQTIRKDVKPVTHEQNWVRFHGQKAKDGDQQGLNQCSLCHTEDSCNSCHKTQAPTNHTNAWRQRDHGVAVSIDRDTCNTCHQSDFCAACHKTTAPRSHRGQWGGTVDRHCQNCHIPVSGERCSVCHQDGTPSHAKALPTPPTMLGTDCRSCHGVKPNAKMPHVDNGDNCNYCHTH